MTQQEKIMVVQGTVTGKWWYITSQIQHEFRPLSAKKIVTKVHCSCLKDIYTDKTITYTRVAASGNLFSVKTAPKDLSIIGKLNDKWISASIELYP